MSNEEDSKKPEMEEKIKVERKRRRLYDAPEGGAPGEETPGGDVPKGDANGAEAPEEDTTKNVSSTLRRANKIVETYSLWSSGAAALPIPMVDMAYIIGVQLKMLSELSELYGLEFRRNRGKSLVASLVSGVAAGNFLSTAAPWMIRYVPVIGFLAAPVSIVLFSSSVTYATGKVFIQHFEAGGTFLNFKPEEVKAYFREQYRDKYKSMKN